MARIGLEIHQIRRFCKAVNIMGQADKITRDALAQDAKINADLQDDSRQDYADIKPIQYSEQRLQHCLAITLFDFLLRM